MVGSRTHGAYDGSHDGSRTVIYSSTNVPAQELFE